MTASDLTQRRDILFTMLTVLTFRYPSGREPALILALRAWLGGWTGIGRIAVGMARQGYDLQLTRYNGEGWRATFFPEPDALADGGGRVRVGTGAVGRGAAGGVEGRGAGGASGPPTCGHQLTIQQPLPSQEFTPSPRPIEH